jgi:hypothetical protein
MDDVDRASVRSNPFESIESAHEYVTLLRQQVQEVAATVQGEIDGATPLAPGRRQDAVRLVAYKLGQLQQQLTSSGRILNDLRVLRRLLLGEREEASPPPSVCGAVSAMRASHGLSDGPAPVIK